MKPIPLLVILVTLNLNSCKNNDSSINNNDSIIQTYQYNERSSGDLPLSQVKAIVIENQLGPVIIDGSSDTSEVGWFLDKWATTESQTVANQVFSQIRIILQTINDTAFVTVQVPLASSSYSSLLSLTVPDIVPCILRKVSGTTLVSYLHSSFTGENLATTTIQAQQGDCFISGANGDASVEIALPDSGVCRINLNSGNITLKIPLATSSLLSAQTGNGTILHSGLVIEDSARTKTSLTGKLGTGRGNIQLSTETGNIIITGF